MVRSNEQNVLVLTTRLLEVAIDHFGRSGFKGASTRAIAQDSGTAMSSITYHFGGKEGLYLAAAEHIGRCIAQAQAGAIESARLALNGSREDAVAALLDLLDSLVNMMLGSASAPWAKFIVREQQEPSKAFDAIYRGGLKEVTDVFVALVGRIRADLAPSEVRATAVLLIGQATILRAGWASVCRILDTETLGPEAQQLLRVRIRAHATSILSEKFE